MLAHGSVFVEEKLHRLVALVRLGGDEERFEEPIGAEPDVCDQPRRVREPVHCQRHLLRRRLRRRRAG